LLIALWIDALAYYWISRREGTVSTAPKAVRASPRRRKKPAIIVSFIIPKLGPAALSTPGSQ